MDPSRKEGNFFGYIKSSKVQIIYVSAEIHIEFNKYVTFHEEVAFKLSKEIQCDSYMEEHETPMMGEQYSGSLHLDVQREEPKVFLYSVAPEEPVEMVDRSLDECPAKKRFTWC